MSTELLKPLVGPRDEVATEVAGEILRDTDDAFVELVCADDDLLRAEFEAIIEANWPSTPRSSAGLPWPERPSPRRSHRTTMAPIAPPVRRGPAAERGGRQRSPPRAPPGSR